LSAPAPARPANPPGTFAVGGGATSSIPAIPPTAQPAAGAQPANGAAETRTKFDSALEGALDGASSQIDFDALTERYRGKKVWVIDRDKIRRNVARVADQAIAQSLVNDEGTAATRERVADAINELFKDTRNLTSQQNTTNTSLEKQISRLASVIKQFEASMAQMQSAIRNIGSGGGGGYGPRRSRGAPEGQKQEQNAVLLEIFKTNLDLLRGMEEEMRVASGTALDAVITESQGAESTVEMSGEPEAAVAQSASDSQNND
jgi:hypothetical protein